MAATVLRSSCVGDGNGEREGGGVKLKITTQGTTTKNKYSNNNPKIEKCAT